MSVDGSVPTTVAGDEAPSLKPMRIAVAPCTTWSFVTMSPSRSITNPDPSAWTCWLCEGANGVAGTFCVCVSVMTTTPGAACL